MKPSATPLINRTRVRDYARSRIKATGRKFTLVSEKFYDQLEARIKVVINDAIHRHPSRGKTLRDIPQGFL